MEVGSRSRPLRILVVHSLYASGAASGENRVVEDEVRLLREAGHSVQLWEPTAGDPPAIGRLQLARRAVWARDAVREVRRLVRTEGIEIVHCHNLFPMLSPAAIRVGGGEGVAVVATLHNYRLLCLPGTCFRDGHVCESCLGRIPWRGVAHGCYRDSRAGSAALTVSLGVHRAVGTFDRVALYLAVSRHVRDKYVESGFEPGRILVKANFAWPMRRRRGPGEYFVYIGRLAPEKGIATALDAWRRVPARLIVVGDGPQAERLRSLAPPNVEFRGAVPPDDLPEILARARALVLPTRWYEGSPRTVYEAYAAGVPVLASDIGALPELLDDGTTGYLVPPGDAAAWAHAAERLLDDGEAVRMGEGAWRRWKTDFSPERALAQLEVSYHLALQAISRP